MLRVIISRTTRDSVSGAEWQRFETIDIDVPELEARLAGGFGETGYDIPHVVGIEILRDES